MKGSDNLIISEEYIQKIIYTIRGKQVMLDSDLAKLYQVETRVLNQAVKRNIKRFPSEFMFQLTSDEHNVIKEEKKSIFSQSVIPNSNLLTSQNVTLKNKRGKHRKYLPYVFTEQGVSMLSAVLKSDTAIEVSKYIITVILCVTRKYRNRLKANAHLTILIET